MALAATAFAPRRRADPRPHLTPRVCHEAAHVRCHLRKAPAPFLQAPGPLRRGQAQDTARGGPPAPQARRASSPRWQTRGHGPWTRLQPVSHRAVPRVWHPSSVTSASGCLDCFSFFLRRDGYAGAENTRDGGPCHRRCRQGHTPGTPSPSDRPGKWPAGRGAGLSSQRGHAPGRARGT